MEDIIQILIFAVTIIAVIVKSFKSDDKQETPSPKEVMKDLFPDMIETPEEVVPAPVTHKPHPKPVFQQTEVIDEVRPVKPVSTSVPMPTLKEKGIRFRTKQDVRRAFIYSELFSRKY